MGRFYIILRGAAAASETPGIAEDHINVNISITAPGWSIGNVLKADAEGKLARLSEVNAVKVQIVFDPSVESRPHVRGGQTAIGI
jgi:metal-sulfur cluster biosynthetic enzyme